MQHRIIIVSDISRHRSFNFSVTVIKKDNLIPLLEPTSFKTPDNNNLKTGRFDCLHIYGKARLCRRKDLMGKKELAAHHVVVVVVGGGGGDVVAVVVAAVVLKMLSDSLNIYGVDRRLFPFTSTRRQKQELEYRVVMF